MIHVLAHAAAIVLPLASAAPPPLFEAAADARTLQMFRVEGLTRPASGTVYPAGSLEQGGMPLGGLGTGYLCLDTVGRFGKTSIFNRYPAPMVLDQPFLTLIAGDRRFLLAAPKDGRGDAKAIRYFGHFPVADVLFEIDAPLRVELRAYSPFILGDAAASNAPAAVFEVKLTNLAGAPQKATIEFSPGGFPAGEAEPFALDGWSGIQVTQLPIERLPAWIRHTYAIAVESGSARCEEKAAIASAAIDLAPGERAVARFILAWHQPYLREASGRVEKHKYAERFPDAKAAAARAAKSSREWLRRILAQQETLYGSDLPPWLQEELVNVPYTLAKNSTWLARTRPDDWWGDEGLFLVNESFSTCSVSETMPCRFFGHWPALFFFPELERTALEAIRYFQLRGGEPPFCLGLGFSIRDPRFHCQHTCGAGEYAQMIYRYYLRTGDETFLKEFWESARDSIRFMLWLDRDGDGLVEDHPHAIEGEGFPGNNPLDVWPWYGPSSYTAGKALAALICGIRMAELAGDAKQAAAWREALERGRHRYDEDLWMGSYYRTYAGDATHKPNDACFSAQLSSVWSSRVLGLEDPLPRERIEKALDTIARLNIPASPFGMVDAVFPDGTVCTEARWANDIFIQCNATAAMVYLYFGRRADGEKAARTMLDTIFRGPHPMPWSQPCGISSATGGTCHGHDYYDHMVVWSYPLAFAGQDIRAACAKGGLISRILEAGAEAEAEVPSEAPRDAIMAAPSEIDEAMDWASLAFTGAERAGAAPRIPLTVRRQEHNVLRFGRSCMETPIRIGGRLFDRGLGTHAGSEIEVRVPRGAKAFQAFVGVDDNDDTRGIRGTVEFAVEIGGKEVARTPTCRGGGEPVPVRVDISPGTDRIILRTDPTPDGTAYDQADWADASFILDGDRTAYLDENQLDIFIAGAAPPFSFLYGGTPSSELLAAWSRTVESSDFSDRIAYRIQWKDPKTGLRVESAVSVFKRIPAADWVLSFENQGEENSPILAEIQPLDAELRTGVAAKPAILHQLHGDVCGERSFLPFDTTLVSGKGIRVAPEGGRSSNGAFPFFNIEYGGQGIIIAIGWSGQWAASFERSDVGPTRVRAGMEETHLSLRPGERIRTPRILVLPWTGDRQAAHNRFRRLLLFHYVPKEDDRPVRLPIFWQGFDRYSGRPGWATEAGQRNALAVAHEVGCEVLWLDAAWFPGGFPNGVGNWSANPQTFPNGLRPLSDAAHALGMQFILWFEPERVAPGTEIAREHPEFVFGGEKGGLFRLDDPAARKWLTDLLSRRIDEFGLQWYRNDFNIDPLGFWRRHDPPDRRGMTEIRYIEGLYEMWDALLARNPGLLIDNCSSGGRRIDIETCMRSIPLWRSDTSCSPGHPEWNQAQTFGLSHFLPLHTACGWTPEPYEFRSAATAGAITQFAFLDDGFPIDLAKATIAEVKGNRPYWYGDFYPLTACATAADEFVAYQFHRADLDAGLVLAFRRKECDVAGLIVGLSAVDPGASYAVEFLDETRRRTERRMSGRELGSNIELRIPNKGASLLVRYRRD